MTNRGEDMKVFKSIEEVRKRYFPKFHEEELFNKLSPAEQGRKLAQKSLNRLIPKEIK